MKLSKTALRLLKNQYGAVLLACALGAFVSTGVKAEISVINPNSGTSGETVQLGIASNGTGTAETTDIYSKSEVDDLLDDKANTSDVYTKTEVDDFLSNKQATLTSSTDITVDDITATSIDVSNGIKAGTEDKFQVDENGAITNVASVTSQGDVSGVNLSATGAITGGSADISGGIKAGTDDKFQVDGDGAITNATSITSQGDVSGVNLSATGAITGGSADISGGIKAGMDDKFQVDANGAITNAASITSQGAVFGTSLSAGTGAITGGNLTANGIATSGTEKTVTLGGSDYTTTVTGKTVLNDSKGLQFGETGQNVTSIDAGSTSLTSGSATALATTATVLKSAENAVYTGSTENIASTFTDPATLESAISDLDNAIGNRDSLASKNTAINTGTETSVAAGLKAAGDAIGTMDFVNTRYINSASDLTSASRLLDTNLNRVEGRVDSLEKKVDKMDDRMNSGFASLAAMSGLQPNARACNDTQLAVGAGTYRGEVGYALGAFHYFNDNVMMNLGASYAGNNSATFKGGVTFGW